MSTNNLPDLPPITTTIDWHDAPDDHLQSLAEISFVIGITVTLYLPWGLVFGSTISGAHFFKESAEPFRDSAEQGADMLLQSVLDPAIKACEQFNKLTGDELIHEGHDMTRFIHLRDAVSLVNGSRVKHARLRIQLSDVSAWTLGGFDLD